MRQIRFSGIVKLADTVRRRLAEGGPESSLNEAYDQIVWASRQVEHQIQTHQIPVQELTPDSRTLRGWFAYFSQRANFEAYVEAVKRGKPVLEAAVARQKRFRNPVVLHFLPSKGLYKVRGHSAFTEIFLPTAMICLTTEEFALLADFMFHSRRHRQALLELAVGGRCWGVQNQIEQLGGPADHTAGKTYDLAAAFDRVNALYFESRMPRPKLSWSRKRTRRKFGHFDFSHDAVIVSRTLDRPEVPEFVVDYIMYHELLHKHLGLRWKNGRQGAHTPEFRRAMKRFPQFKEAEDILRRLASGRGQE